MQIQPLFKALKMEFIKQSLGEPGCLALCLTKD